jgi:hypothetical protein
VELALIFGIAPGRLRADRIGGRALKLALVDLDDITAEVGVVSEQRLGQRVIRASHSKESAE